MPPERNAISCSFLFGLLRAAVVLECTLACRLDLERRIGLQLEQATLDDLLIPSVNHSGETLFDVDAVQRILNCFMQQDGDGEVDVRLETCGVISTFKTQLHGLLSNLNSEIELVENSVRGSKFCTWTNTY